MTKPERSVLPESGLDCVGVLQRGLRGNDQRACKAHPERAGKVQAGDIDPTTRQ